MGTSLPGEAVDLSDRCAAESPVLSYLVALAYARVCMCARACPPTKVRQEVAIVPPPPVAPPKVAGGSPWQVFYNERQKAAKALATPDQLTPSGVLKPEVREAFKQKCKDEWNDFSDEDKNGWRTLFQERRAERQRDLEQVAVGQGSNAFAPEPHSHWGMGARGSVVHPDIVSTYFQAGNKLPTAAEVYDPNEFRVQPPPEAQTPMLGEGILIIGCPMRGRNMCPSDPDARRINQIGAGFSNLVQAIGRQKASSGDVLVLCEGVGVRDPARWGERPRLFVLLTLPVYRPVYQDWTWCKPLDAGTNAAELAFPFEVQIDECPVRLQIEREGPVVAVHHLTSVELAKKMLATAASWTLQVLAYEIVTALKMRVVGFDNPSACPISCQPPVVGSSGASAGSKRQRVKDTDIDALRGLGDLDADPLAALPPPGRKQRMCRETALASSTAIAPRLADDAPLPPAAPLAIDPELEEWAPHDPHAPAEPEDEGVPDGSTMDANLLALGAGTLEEPFQLHRTEDVPGDSLSVEMGLGGVAQELVDEGVGLAGEIGAVTVLVAEGPAAAEDTGTTDEIVTMVRQASLPPPENVRFDIEGAPTGWSITPAGFVFNAEHRQVGKITRWGKNVSCKCSVNHFAHGSCSLAKSDKVASTGQLMRWLQLGQERLSTPAGSAPSNPARVQAELRQQHLRLWTEIAQAK